MHGYVCVCDSDGDDSCLRYCADVLDVYLYPGPMNVCGCVLFEYVCSV
jgi:hypothetical protein